MNLNYWAKEKPTTDGYYLVRNPKHLEYAAFLVKNGEIYTQKEIMGIIEDEGSEFLGRPVGCLKDE